MAVEVSAEGVNDPTPSDPAIMEHDLPAQSDKGKEKIFVMEAKLHFQNRHMTTEDFTLKEPEVAYALASSLMSPNGQEILNRVKTLDLGMRAY